MDKYLIPNLLKAILMLKLLAANEQGLSAVQFEQRLNIPRTTAFRILKTLLQAGMIEKKESFFFPGPSLMEVGLMALQKSQVRGLAVPFLQKLTEQTGMTAHLAIPSGWHSLILEVCDSADPIRVASRPGTLADLHCSATGKIFLAFCYADRLEEFCRDVQPAQRTAHTVTTLDGLRTLSAQVRKQGYAVDEQEYHLNVRCLAAPVKDMRRQVVAALGVTAPDNVFTHERIEAVRQAVVEAASTLSLKNGYSM